MPVYELLAQTYTHELVGSESPLPISAQVDQELDSEASQSKPPQ